MISNVNENSLIFNHREEFRRHQNKIESDVQKLAGALESMIIEMPTTPLSDKNLSASFNDLPEEVVHKILSYVTNKRESWLIKVGVSGLEPTRWVSKQFHALAQIARKDWISEQSVSLKSLGCKNAQEAIDYAINNKLEAVNLEGFPDIHDGHIQQLIDKRPNISRLFINSNMFYNQCCNIGNLKDLKELELQSNSVCILDLSKCEKLEEVTLNYCTRLFSLTLPETAPHLRCVSCCHVTQLQTLPLPKKAPMLEYLDCIHCDWLKSITLPEETPALKQLWATHCLELSSVQFPNEAPALKMIYLPGCPQLSNIKMPEQAPSLAQVEFSGAKLTSLSLPKKTPVLEKITLSSCRELSQVALPEEAPRLEYCSFTTCDKLARDNMLNADKYEHLRWAFFK